MFDVDSIKKDFPIFKNHPEIHYLDSAASSLKLNKVIDKLDYYYNFLSVNVNRGPYKLSYEATNLYDDSRINIAKHLNCNSNEIIFTRGATNSLNLASLLLEPLINENDEIITSELEHNSSILPWINICKKKKAKLVYVPLTKEGRITIENFKKVINKNTKIVALTHVSNVMGYITPVKEICKISKEYKAITIIDGAQAIPHMKVDLKDLNCDFYCFSGHKMLGPTGIGILYGRYDLLDKLEPVEYGGDMALDVSKENQTYKNPPYKFEAGTPIIAEAIALSEAFDYLDKIGYDNIHRNEQDLFKYTYDKLSKIKEVIIHNPTCETGVLTFNVKDIHPHDVAQILNEDNVYVRVGNHCAHICANFLKVDGTIRASFYLYNDYKDCDALVNSVKRAIDFFGKF